MRYTTPSFYITGGTLPRDAPSYIIRRADTELFDGLLEGRFCYVLTSRQMGKSSLMVRTAARLRQESVTCAVLDLTAVGQDLTREQWYDGLQNALGRQLGLEEEMEAFWLSHERLSPLQRWMLALERVVLSRIDGNIVLFIDEIDSVRSLPFSADEFFAAIREFYNRRTECEALKRLAFCLLGVAAPSDLIRDTRTTPFNIGLRIDLTDFTLDEAAPLANGMVVGTPLAVSNAEDRPDVGTLLAASKPAQGSRNADKTQQAASLLGRVLYWTGGHPYLTQQLCYSVAGQLNDLNSRHGNDSGATDAVVDSLCAQLLVSAQARVQNDNLLFVRDRLLRSEVDAVGLLQLYGQVHSGRAVNDDEANPLITVLRLSGITRSSGGRLHVRNRIYSRVFDQGWIAANMPDAEIRRQKAAFRRGVIRTAVLSGAIVLVLAALGVTAMRQARDARRATALSRRYAAQMDTERKQADTARLAAVKEAQRAQNAEVKLAGALGVAEVRRKDAEHQKLIARAKSIEAENARRETSLKLRDSYLAQAQASRWSGRVGQKYDSLAALEKAATFPASPEFRMNLRNEAIACMELPIDLRPVGRHRLCGASTTVSAMDDRATLFVTADSDGTVYARTLSDGKEVARFRHPGGRFLSARFSPGARYVAIVWQVNNVPNIRIWDLRTRSLSWKSADNDDISGVSFSRDGTRILFCLADKSVRMLDLQTGLETTIGKYNPSRRGGWFSPDGHYLAYLCGTTRTIRFLDLKTKSETEVDAASDIKTIGWSMDGALLAASGADNNVNVWNVPERRLVVRIQGHLSLTTKISFLRDGRLLATSGFDGMLRFWEVHSGRHLLSLPAGAFYRFTQDERRLYVVELGMAHEFEVDAGMECRTFAHSTANSFAVDFLRGTNLMVTCAQEGTRFWDIANGSQQAFLKTGSMSQAAFGANYGCLVHYGDADSRLTVRPLHFDLNANLVRIGPPSASKTIEDLVPLRCSLNGSRLICGRGSSLSLFNLPHLDREQLLQPHTELSMAAISPDLRWAASGGFHGTNAKIWDARTGVCAAELPTRLMTNVDFSPDGKWLVTGNSQKYQFWHVGTWRLFREIARAPSGGLVGIMAFTKDGRQAALAHTLSMFHLLDPASGEIYAELKTPTESILTPWATFSPDGAFLACGTESGVSYLWDLRKIRVRLARMGLDWNAPVPTPESKVTRPLRVEIEASRNP